MGAFRNFSPFSSEVAKRSSINRATTAFLFFIHLNSTISLMAFRYPQMRLEKDPKGYIPSSSVKVPSSSARIGGQSIFKRRTSNTPPPSRHSARDLGEGRLGLNP